MRRLTLLALLVPISPAVAQKPDPAKLTLDRIFASGDFRGERVPGVKWLDGAAYTTLEPAAKGSDLVKYDAAGKKEVLVPADKLASLAVHGYELSKDLDVVLIYTNSRQVWRQNTRGDYW